MGTRLSRVCVISIAKDHPHAYGDKVQTKNAGATVAGSSPRVWGQVISLTVHKGIKRIIPTRMGTRLVFLSPVVLLWDHPHAYGDKKNQPSEVAPFLGSSPRVWGQVVLYLCKKGVVRIIPTRMGTRLQIYALLVLLWDHPHAYGDKSKDVPKYLLTSGSSPRVWGQVCKLCVKIAIRRIIPTRMGTRHIQYFSKFGWKDHPHAYGDKDCAIFPVASISGSSPRVWGQDGQTEKYGL